MTSLETERQLRQKAARSAIASVTIGGLRPTPFLLSMLSRWTEGNTSLSEIRSALLVHLTQSND
jgi:hypothetical protein